jgi:hypothetical protein
MTSQTKHRLARYLHRLEHAVVEPPQGDRLLSTPDADDWAGGSLSRRQLDTMLRRGRVHRRHGQP